ncbi:MAG: Polysacc-synt-C domain-containing protein [Atopobium sp.]|jgi:O-antigen/teichoic acid export membrane protein
MTSMIKKLKDKYAGLSQVKRAALWITLSGFILRGISFITVPIFTRLLTTDEYGSFSVYQSWESVFVYVVTLGVAYGGFNNGMVRYPDDREGYTTSVMGLICTMGAAWAIVAMLFHDQASAFMGMPGSYILLMLVEVVASEIYDVWACRARYDFEYKKVVAAAVVLAVGVPALGIPFVVIAQDKVLARIVSFILVYLAMAIVLGGATLRRSKRLFCWDYWKFTLAFNIPLLPHYLSEVLLNSSDRIMISQFCSASDAGIYSIAYSAGMLMAILTGSLNNTVIPWLYRKLDSKDYSPVNRTGLEILGFLAVAILLMDALAPDVVAILAPAKYGEAMELVPVIAASVFFIYLYSYCSNIEFFYEETKIAAVASIVAAVLNVVLNAIFIPMFGYRVAGYTTLVCYIALAINHYYFAQRIAKRKTGHCILNGKAIWIMATSLTIASIVFSGIYAYPIARYAALIAIVALLAAKKGVILDEIREMRA